MKNFIKKALAYYENPKYKAIVNYIFFGVCTTLVNFITFYLLRKLGVEINIANVISISLSIVFAYFVNARYVFSSRAKTIKKVMYELSKFFTARIVTMLIEIFGVLILVWFSMNDFLAKFIIQFVVLIANYLISKFLVFNKK